MRRHLQEWAAGPRGGVPAKAAFVPAAQGLDRRGRAEQAACRLCPDRPAAHTRLRLCQRHLSRWIRGSQPAAATQPISRHWLAGQDALAGYGTCRVMVCPSLAASPLGLCSGHATRYERDGGPAGRRCPGTGRSCYEQQGLPVPVAVQRRAAVR